MYLHQSRPDPPHVHAVTPWQPYSGYKENFVLQILQLKPSPKSASQVLPPFQENNQECWLSFFRSQIINPSGVSLSRAFSGGKGGCPSIFLSTKRTFCKSPSHPCVLGTPCSLREKWVIFFGCLLYAAMSYRANSHSVKCAGTSHQVPLGTSPLLLLCLFFSFKTKSL